MTKTLTEQWRDGTLEDRDYYVLRDDEEVVKLTWSVGLFLDTDVPLYGEDEKRIKEVLAKVPSYEEYKDLYDSNKQLMTHIKTCEQQIERLQEQLKEANEVIKWYAQPDTGSAKDYLEKWGVK